MASRGRIINAGTRNLTPTEKRATAGHARFLALRQHLGKDPVTREMVGPSIWWDSHANKSYAAGENWEKPPPDLPIGDPGRRPSYLPPSVH